jgi:hypothetical protein
LKLSVPTRTIIPSGIRSSGRRRTSRTAARTCPRARGVRRELVPGSLRVYPISGYGAVQTGEHRFVQPGGAPPTTARFVHVWRYDGGAWKASRILSLDHQEAARSAAAP